jgi:inner membrane protein
MDSLTQMALGACVTAVCVPREQMRRAIVIGAALGTLPDLDVAIDFGDAVRNFTMHRGFSHSLFVLIPLSFLIWILLRKWWEPVRRSPRSWLAAISLTLTTHTLLDAHTAYGTQLWWPFNPPPTAWATLFIIDPVYSLPLLVAALAVFFWPSSHMTRRWLATGLVLSTAYVAWSWTAREIVLSNARRSLSEMGILHPSVFVTPSPFNTLLWRVIAVHEDQYFEGFDSIATNDGLIEFSSHPRGSAQLKSNQEIPAVERLSWFANGFVRAEVEQDKLIITDLRMGFEPDYVFRHVVATYGNPHWSAIRPERLESSLKAKRLGEVWQRIWKAP